MIFFNFNQKSTAATEWEEQLKAEQALEIVETAEASYLNEVLDEAIAICEYLANKGRVEAMARSQQSALPVFA